jgi:hypothetical protein
LCWLYGSKFPLVPKLLFGNEGNVASPSTRCEARTGNVLLEALPYKHHLQW